MDPRIRDHADVIVNHTAEIEQNDDVLLEIPPEARELAVAIAELLGERGASLYTAYPHHPKFADRITMAYLKNIPPEELDTPDHQRDLYQTVDAVILVEGGQSGLDQDDISTESQTVLSDAFAPLEGELFDGRPCITRYPTRAGARRANMTVNAYEDLVWGAINRDWEEQRSRQSRLVEILDEGSEIRIEAGERTDLRASIDGMTAENDYGESGLPGGEVFTAPVVDSVEGHVLFDLPVVHDGSEIVNARLTFENGRVVEYAAERGEAILDDILGTDDGARRVGEIGFGMNEAIDSITYNIAFDEKMDGTVHLALGQAYGRTVGDNRTQNESAVHVDLLADMRDDAQIEVDGNVIFEDGKFTFV